jgi:AraC-like DNA-binding protein
LETKDHAQAEREVRWTQASRDELVERIARLVPQDGPDERLPGVLLRRASAPTELGHGVSYPSFCVIAQGSKEILLGESHYRYDPTHYLITSAALPIATRIVEASPERPYLAFVLRLDPVLVGSVMVEAGHPAPRATAAVRAIDVSPLDAGLLDAVVRFVRLADAPAEARFLAPLIIREIVYRLLLGAQGGRLGHITALGGTTHRIAAAVERLRRDFDRPLSIEAMARELGMSVSGFHHHFKALTAMSPLPFQKQLRLPEARRLLLGEEIDAASAGRRVGYDDAAYYNREYKRLFGAPPLRHLAGMRDSVHESAGL